MRYPVSRKIRRYAPTQEETSESYLESAFMLAIRLHKLPFPRREYPVGKYSIDFAYPLIMLGIELDGNQHFTSKGQLHDQQRDAFLKACGWEILRADRNSFHKPAFIKLIKITIAERLRKLK